LEGDRDPARRSGIHHADRSTVRGAYPRARATTRCISASLGASHLHTGDDRRPAGNRQVAACARA